MRIRSLALAIGLALALVATACGDGGGGLDVDAAHAAVDGFFDDNDVSSDFDDPSVEADCPVDFAELIGDQLGELDDEIDDIEDADASAFGNALGDQVLACTLLIDHEDDDYEVGLFVTRFSQEAASDGFLDGYRNLAGETGVDIDIDELDEAAGGEVFAACADDLLFPGEEPGTFAPLPYCDTFWVADGLVIGIGQYGDRSLDPDDVRSMLVDRLDEVLDGLVALD